MQTMSHGKTLLRVYGAALLLAAVHFGGELGAAANASETKDAARRVHEILATESGSGGTSRDSALVGNLVELGPEAIPELVRVHLGELDGEVATFDFSRFERSGRLALAALVRLPVDRVLVHLELLYREQPKPETALVVMRVAGALEKQEAVPFVFQLMTELDGPQIAAGPLRRAGVDALVELFTTSPRGLLSLQGQAMSEVEPGIYVGSFKVAAGESGVPWVVGHLLHAPSGARQSLREGGALELGISAPRRHPAGECRYQLRRRRQL